MKDLREMTAKELKEMAKGLRISNWWNLKKEVLIKKIEEVQSLNEEETKARADEIMEEDKLFEHYQKNWRKYGSTNNWSKFLANYKKGKITLILEEEAEEGEATEATEEAEVITEVPISQSEEVSEEPKENTKSKNKRTNLKLTELTYKGETKSIRAWAEEINMPWPTLYDRVNRNGWTVEDAIETPLGQRRPK